MSELPVFSIVIPVYQNGLNLPHTIPAVLEFALTMTDFQVEAIFVDDGSKDDSYVQLERAGRENPDVIRVIKLTRNFGQRAATIVGMRYARGAAIGVISADLQDPIDLFQAMLKDWKAGKKLIFAVREKRPEGLLSVLTSKLFYRLIRKFVAPDYPRQGFDFFVVDKSLRDLVVEINQKDGHLMLLLFRLGFPYSVFPYERKARTAGKSQYSFLKRLDSLVDAFVANSYAPIRLVSIIGFMSAAFGFLFGVYVIIDWIRHYPHAERGWASIIVMITFFSGMVMMSLGIIGEYLWRTSQQVRSFPMYLVETSIGIDRGIDNGDHVV